jgi:hypothetical protein
MLTTEPKPPVRALCRQQLQSARADADPSEALAGAGQVGEESRRIVKRIEYLPPQNSRAKGSEVSKIGWKD